MKLIIDLETNGFLEKLDKVHCIVCKDIETSEVYSYNPNNLNDALELLNKAEVLIACARKNKRCRGPGLFKGDLVPRVAPESARKRS